VDDVIRFHLQRRGKVTGPVTDDEVRDALRAGRLEADVRVRLVGSELWASPRAFATFARTPSTGPLTSPPAPTSIATELPADLAATPQAVRDLLLFWMHEGELTFGPLSGEQIRTGVDAGQYRSAAACLVDTTLWMRASALAAPRATSAVPAEQYAREPSMPSGEAARPRQRTILTGAAAGPTSNPAVARASSPSAGAIFRCPTCLERIAAGSVVCPECAEPVNAAPPSMGGSPSIPDALPGQSFFSLHWRPIVTMGTMAALICTGVMLRHLAPGRFLPQRAATSKAAASTAPGSACSVSCWNGESCQNGRCVWQPPNDVTHVAAAKDAQPTVSGPFALPRDASDALPLDGERFAVSLLTGLQLHNARTGGVLGLVTDAPQSRRLYRVGDVVYATAPQRIYVVEAGTTRILKTIETNATVGEVVVGANGRRALASLPSAHAVAVLATEYHAEIDRIQFGDDPVGPMGADDTGKRALTTTGQVPLPGLRDPQGGAVYAFDPSRLASAQDRVRTSVLGNPVSVLMTPDGQQSWVALRAEDALVPLEWQPSGAVRQEARIPTCREPEQIGLVRRGRLAVVRCNEGRAIEVFDIHKRELVRHVPFNARVADMAIAPDGKQAIVALPAEGTGFVGLVDLETWAVKVLPVGAEPTRVRLAPDGSMALVLSDRAKVAWVIR
jgi:DNA-binding beta-propeller fold protein YncE